MNSNALQLYLFLLGRARYSTRVSADKRGRVAEIGQAFMGRDDLAAKCGLSPSKIRTALRLLERLYIVTIETTSRGTIVTLEGYAETYCRRLRTSPAESPADDPLEDSDAPTEVMPHATIKKEDRKTDETETYTARASLNRRSTMVRKGKVSTPSRAETPRPRARM